MSLSPAARPGRVRVQISDLSRSIAFYEDVLGLVVVERAGAVVTLAPAGGPVIVELHEHVGARPVPRRAPWGLYHFAILLPDRASLGRFVVPAWSSGAVSGAADHAVSEAIYLSDPDGLGVEVYRDRPRDEWRRLSSGELRMVTEPLDVEAVVAAAGGADWTGAPAGTRMGHIHLHVGDLSAANAFYHGAIGFERVVWSYPGALFLAAGGYHHHLGTNTWGAPYAPASDQARLLSWDLELPDETAVSAVAERLTRLEYALQRSDSGWIVSDPWGTPLRITTAPAGF